MTDAAVPESSTGSTQAERTALSDQKMFEVAIELVNERGTAKTTLKDIGETLDELVLDSKSKNIKHYNLQ